MFSLTLDDADGNTVEREFKTLVGACQWLMNQRGVLEVSISKDAQAHFEELEEEIGLLLDVEFAKNGIDVQASPGVKRVTYNAPGDYTVQLHEPIEEFFQAWRPGGDE